MIDIVLRYYPIVARIKKLNINSVLEVGSDDYGISPFLKQKVTLLDTNFRRKWLKNVKYVQGSVLDLPFKNNSFEAVVSVDMLEHIPPDLREKAIKETIRVSSKYIFFAFPADPPAEKRDQRLYKIFSLFKGNPFTRYINEHIENGLPRTSQVIKTIEKLKVRRITTQKNINVSLDLPLVLLSNLDFFPILVMQKFILDRYKIDSLPIYFRTFMILFGWISNILTFGKCYRTILIIEK